MAGTSAPLTRKHLEEAEKLLFAISGKKQTLAETISAWRILVNRLEWGYVPEPEEFRDVLKARDLLERIKESGSETLREWLSSVLAPLDSMFFDRTKPAERIDAASDGCWMCRVPMGTNREWEDQITKLLEN